MKIGNTLEGDRRTFAASRCLGDGAHTEEGSDPMSTTQRLYAQVAEYLK
jgi:hypothetical protein